MEREIICSNPLETEINWLNSTKYMVKIMAFNRRGQPTKKFSLLPGEEIIIPPKGYIELLRN